MGVKKAGGCNTPGFVFLKYFSSPAVQDNNYF